MSVDRANAVVAGAVAVFVGAVTLGPAGKVILRWERGTDIILQDGIPVSKAKAKPLDTPATGFLTYFNTPWSTDSLNYHQALYSGSPRLAFAVTEPMPGAVTAPVVELIEYQRAASDDAAALIVRPKRSA